MEVILFFVLVYAAKKAWDDSKLGAAKSRKAYMARAAKKYPGMSGRQASRHALRHDIGHVLSQLFRGFPNARHGFASGWHEGRQAHAQARAGHQRAKAEHLEARARLIPDLTSYRARQKAALERIRAGTGPDVKAACNHAPAPCVAPDLCSCDCPDCMAAFSAQREVPEAGSEGSEGSEGSSGQPAVNDRQRARDADPRLRNACSACGHDGTDDDPLVLTRGGSRVHRSHTLDPDDGFYGEGSEGGGGRRPPDCWLCGLPVDGGELGASAHQRCLDVNDRDMERTEVEDDRDLESVESDLFAQGKCSHQTTYGDGGSPRYCGQPVSRDGNRLCGQHEAEAVGDDNRATAEIHRRTRELLQEDGGTPSSSSTTEGTPMASEVTYDGVIRRMDVAVGGAEDRQARIGTALADAEDQAESAGAAQRWADQTAEEMQALNVDSATLGAMADHQDALAATEKAHQAVLEALAEAKKAQGRVTETAQNVKDTLERGHAGLKQAHDDAPVEAADRTFYQD